MKKIFLVLAAVVLVFGAQSAMAVTITYSTLGCFYQGAGPCIPVASDTAGPSDQLVYNAQGSTTVDTVGFPLGAVSAFLGSFAIQDFSTYDFAANDWNFLLRVIVTAPAPGGSDDFIADVEGAVNGSTLNSSVNVVFDPTLSHGGANPPHFLFTAADGTDVSIHIESQTVPRESHPLFGGVPANIQGHFHTESPAPEIPEPATMALMGSGLLFVGLFARKFKK
jgi:hypothetical protein